MKKILVVEGDTTLEETLLKKIKENNYEVKMLKDGLEVLSTLKGFKPDLMILDISLSGKNGFDVLDEVNKDPETSHVSTIVLLNSGEVEDVTKILGLGVKDYMVKAEFDSEELLTKIRTQLDEKIQTDISSEKQNSFETSLSGKKILWVEDDEFLGEIVEKKLNLTGCNLTHVKNGEDALAFLESNLADIVVLDIILPVLDGFEILKRIKDNPKTTKIPVILLSNLGQNEDLEKGKSLGAETFLIKATFTLDEVILKIAKILATK